MKFNKVSTTLAASAIFVASAVSCQAVNVVISGYKTSEIEKFLATYYTDANVTAAGNFGNFGSAATAAALAAGGGADLVIIGRTLNSADYDNGDADGYNTLDIPLISFTSYVSRSVGDRLGWHTGTANHSHSVLGTETFVTAAGSRFFGMPAGAYDYYESNPEGTFNGLGTGSVGGGDILATIGGDILAAYWPAGTAPGDPGVADVATFPADRLLFNLDNDPSPDGEFTNQTGLGLEVVVSAVSQIGGLTIVPEPASAFLGLFGLGVLSLGRRR